MFEPSTQADYLERAGMHEKLADSTSDIAARKMHQAMAAEYRRKAADAEDPVLSRPIAKMTRFV